MTQDFFNLGLAQRDPVEEARFLSLQRVRGYWEGLIGPGGALPGPAALDPRGLLPALEDVFLAERIGEGLLRLRIAGRRVSAPAGVDMQGLPLSALFLPEGRPALAHTIERVCNHHSLVTMELTAEGGFGRPALTARLLLLPLAPPLRGMPAILGCLSTLGDVGRTPRRFAVTSVIEERLGQRIAAASAPASHPVDLPDFALPNHAAQLPELAEEAVPFVRPTRPLRRDPAALRATGAASAPPPGDHPVAEDSGRAGEETPTRPRLRLVHSSDYRPTGGP